MIKIAKNKVSLAKYSLVNQKSRMKTACSPKIQHFAIRRNWERKSILTIQFCRYTVNILFKTYFECKKLRPSAMCFKKGQLIFFTLWIRCAIGIESFQSKRVYILDIFSQSYHTY